MEEAKGVVKHVLLAKFKEGISENQIEELTKGYAKLVDLIEPMKSFHWYPLPNPFPLPFFLTLISVLY